MFTLTNNDFNWSNMIIEGHNLFNVSNINVHPINSLNNNENIQVVNQIDDQSNSNQIDSENTSTSNTNTNINNSSTDKN